MATVWGDAEILLHTDGRALPGEVRDATQQAATEGGKSFQKQFKKEMRKAAAESVKDFARSFTQAFKKVLTNSRAFQALSKSFKNLRRDIRNAQLGLTAKNGLNLALDSLRGKVRNLMQPLRNLRFELGNSSAKATKELADGFRHLKITGDDLRATFPTLMRAVDGLRNSFRRTRESAHVMWTEMVDDQRKTFSDLREGFGHMKVSVDDLRDTFPQIAKAVESTNSAFRRAGNAAKRFGERVKEIAPDLRALKPAADETSTAWSRMIDRFRLIRQASSDARSGLDTYRQALKETKQVTEETTKATEEHTRTTDRNRDANRRGIGMLRKLSSSWKRMPHGLRQAFFWIGLVASSMGDLAVLGSALSGTIVALADQLLALGAGVAFAVIGFQGLFAEGANLTAGAKESKSAFEELGKAFTGIRDTIANGVFGNVADNITNFTNTLLPALQGSIESFSAVVGDQIGKIFDALSSPEGVENFKGLFAGFADVLPPLIDAVIDFGSAIADILIAGMPLAVIFADAIAEVADQFARWTDSKEGTDRLTEFFGTAAQIMPKVVDLIVALADAISGLVTPETIAGFSGFLDSLIEFTPVLGGIIGAIANLNVFGILAAALQLIGELLAPIIPPLQELASLVGEQLITAFNALGPSFAAVGVALQPVIDVLSVLIEAIMPGLILVVQSAVEYIAGFIEALFGADTQTQEFKDGVKIAGDVIGVVFTILGGIIASVMDFTIGILKTVSKLLRGDFSGAFQAMYDTVKKILSNFGVNIDDVIKWMEDLLDSVSDVLGDIGDWFDDVFGGIGDWFSDLGGWISDAIGWFSNLIGAAGNAKSAGSSAANSRGAAAGRMVFGPQRILVGEAGPEAIVPLRRTLSRVDPSVRWLSAIAQGKNTTQSMASGGQVGAGRVVNIADGAIVIQGTRDPNAAAVGVVNRIAERLAG